MQTIAMVDCDNSLPLLQQLNVELPVLYKKVQANSVVIERSRINVSSVLRFSDIISHPTHQQHIWFKIYLLAVDLGGARVKVLVRGDDVVADIVYDSGIFVTPPQAIEIICGPARASDLIVIPPSLLVHKSNSIRVGISVDFLISKKIRPCTVSFISGCEATAEAFLNECKSQKRPFPLSEAFSHAKFRDLCGDGVNDPLYGFGANNVALLGVQPKIPVSPDVMRLLDNQGVFMITGGLGFVVLFRRCPFLNKQIESYFSRKGVGTPVGDDDLLLLVFKECKLH
jgi:hypothetical protein